MKLKLVLSIVLIFSFLSCSDNGNSEEQIKSESNLKLNISGMPEVTLENVTGTVIGSNYEAGFRESAHLIATNSLNDITVSINLIDSVDDVATQAIKAGKLLSIDNSMSTGVYATFTIMENGNTTYEAVSGTISISFYDLLSVESEIIVISGSFNVSNGAESASGTFSEIELNCSECGG